MKAINHGGEPEVLAAAREDDESVVELTRELVTIPSPGGIASYDPVLDRLGAWLDTATFGDDHAWTYPTTLAVIADHLHGSLVLLFNVDEHTGGFGGAKRYFEGPDAPADVAGVMIDYPGMGQLVVGGRSVHRATLHVHGVAPCSGGSTLSAIGKATHLIRVVSTAELPHGPDFPLPGKLTVTAIEGGHGYSVTPDPCTLNVEIRTIPTFDDEAAARLLEHLVAGVDDAWPAGRWRPGAGSAPRRGPLRPAPAPRPNRNATSRSVLCCRARRDPLGFRWPPGKPGRPIDRFAA